jgi:hypothetical protein
MKVLAVIKIIVYLLFIKVFWAAFIINSKVGKAA